MKQQDLFVYVLVFLLTVFCLLLVVPGLGVVFSERELAEKLLRQSATHTFKGKSDLEIRRAIQKLARDEGFNLSTSDVIVQIPDSSRAMENNGRIGYTLVMLVPVLWLFDFELVAVRDVEFGE